LKKYLFLVSCLLFPLLINAQVPASSHVVVVLEENHSYSSVIGNSAMPYFNSLATQYGLATQYYANAHPSIGNYFMLTTGQIITNNDSFSSTITNDNIVRHFLTAGKTWKSYAESLPSVGYIGGDTGAYLRHHNPFTYFSDVVNSSVQRMNLVPFPQFAADMNNNALPDFSFVVPNVNDDAHNGTLQQADQWLQTNIAPLFNNPAFQKDGILIIVFDESFDTDTTHGGGHIAAVVAGPLAKKGFKSTALYQHQNLLRTVMDAVGDHTYPGAAASAMDMSDMFGSNSTPTPTPTPTPGTCTASTIGVTVCSPTSGSTVSSPVTFTAAAKSNNPITALQIYADNILAYTVNSATLNTSLSMTAGSHYVVVQGWDSTGAYFKTPLTVTVGSSTPPESCTASAAGVTVCAPTPGSTSGSPVQFVAAAKSSSSAPITAMRIYVDNVSQYLTMTSSLNTSLSLTSGSHSIVVQAWDSTGAYYKTPLTISVN
jgi:phosphatidylinositol-3-phosphatase